MASLSIWACVCVVCATPCVHYIRVCVHVCVCPRWVYRQKGQAFIGPWVPQRKLIFCINTPLQTTNAVMNYSRRSDLSTHHWGGSCRKIQDLHRWSRMQGCPQTLSTIVSFIFTSKRATQCWKYRAVANVPQLGHPLRWRAHHLRGVPSAISR